MSSRREGHPPSSIASVSGAKTRVAGARRSCRSRAWLVVVALAVLVLAPACAAAQAPVRPVRILLVYGVSPELPEVVGFTKQLRFRMRRDGGTPVEFYPEYLDFDRFPAFGPRLVDFYADKYRQEHIDVILAIGSAAL